MIRHGRAAIVLASLTSVVAANPLTHKAPPPNYPIEALRRFSQASVFEREGSYDDAKTAFEDANRTSEAAAAYYNLAEIAFVFDIPTDAIEPLEHYLALAPTAADRAQIEKLLATIKTTLPARTIGTRATDTYDPRTMILVDGVVVGGSPVTVHPTAGLHSVERISTTGYWRTDFDEPPGVPPQFVDIGRPESNLGTGNVIIDGLFPRNSGRQWKDGRTAFSANERFKLPVGHYQTRGPIEMEVSRLCTAIEFDVKATTEVTYVHVVMNGDPNDDQRCAPVKAVTVQRLLRGTP